MLLETKALTNEISKIKGNFEEKDKANLALQKQLDEQVEKISQLEAIKSEIKEKYDDVVKEKQMQQLDINSTSENLRLNYIKIEELNAALNDTKEKLSSAESQINAKCTEIENTIKAHEGEKALLLSKIEELNVEHKSSNDAHSAQLLQSINDLKQKDIEFNEIKEKLSSAESEISLKISEIDKNFKAFEAEKGLLLTKIENLNSEHKSINDSQNAQLQQTINNLQEKETALQVMEYILYCILFY